MLETVRDYALERLAESGASSRRRAAATPRCTPSSPRAADRGPAVARRRRLARPAARRPGERPRRDRLRGRRRRRRHRPASVRRRLALLGHARQPDGGPHARRRGARDPWRASRAAARGPQRGGRAGGRAGGLRRRARPLRGVADARAHARVARPARARALQPRHPRPVRGRRRRGDPPLRGVDRAVAGHRRRPRAQPGSRRTSASPTALRAITSAPSRCSRRASCSRAGRPTRRTCPRHCARSGARCCSGRGDRAGAQHPAGEPRASHELGHRPGMAECLETLATVLDPRIGAELIGAAEGAREAAGAARQPEEEAWVVEAKAGLRRALGDEVRCRRRARPQAHSHGRVRPRLRSAPPRAPR